jgi:aspartyl protease family protein
MNNNVGKYMSWLAWALGLAILTFAFDDYLEQAYNPNQNPSYSLSAQNIAEVKLQRNRAGHYVTQGYINGHSVTFLLDTGATQVSIPAHIASQLNLPQYGQSIVNTANGRVKVYQTDIEDLSIGNIFLYNVGAHINPAMDSDEILLGMTALKQIEFQQRGKELILRQQQRD